MRRLVAALLLAGGLLSPAPALAAARQDPGIQQCLDQVDPQQIQENGPPSCRMEDGHWVPYWNTVDVTAGFGGIVVLMLVLVLVWSAIPVVACYVLASRSGQSLGVAMLLGIVLGWIGLLVVYLMGRSDTRAAAHVAVDAMGPRAPFPGTAPPPPPSGGPAQRLRTLDGLRDSGAITAEEYTARRQAIIDEV